jgi:2'-phosphotransferase
MRNNSQVLIFIDVAAAMAAGILFSLSVNGVILTSGDHNGLLLPTYFSSVEQNVGGEWEEIHFAEKSMNIGQDQGSV